MVKMADTRRVYQRVSRMSASCLAIGWRTTSLNHSGLLQSKGGQRAALFPRTRRLGCSGRAQGKQRARIRWAAKFDSTGFSKIRPLVRSLLVFGI